MRQLAISRDAPDPKGTGPAAAGDAPTALLSPPMPLRQEVEMEWETPDSSKHPPPPQVDVEAEPESSKLLSPPQEGEVKAEMADTSKHPTPRKKLTWRRSRRPPSASPPQEVEVEAETADTSEHPPSLQEVDVEAEISMRLSPPQEVEMEAEPADAWDAWSTSKHPPPSPQEVEVEAASKHPPPSPQEVEVEADTSKHPPPPQEDEVKTESWTLKHIKEVLKAMQDMGALHQDDERYGHYLKVFFKAYLQAPRPIDPPPLPWANTAGLAPIAGLYPYLADELARIAADDTAEQREMLSRGLLQQVDANTLPALEDELRESTLNGRDAMLAKLKAEVQYAKASIDTEAMIEMLTAGKVCSASSSV